MYLGAELNSDICTVYLLASQCFRTNNVIPLLQSYFFKAVQATRTHAWYTLPSIQAAHLNKDKKKLHSRPGLDFNVVVWTLQIPTEQSTLPRLDVEGEMIQM
jgi:hypothetical protein